MRIKIIFLFMGLFIFFFCGIVYSQEPVCEHIANYKMDVRLDTEKKSITGSEVLTWLNNTYFYTDELYFHLYMNAFKNNKSTFMKESNRNLEEDIEPIKLGYCDIISMKVLTSDYLEETDITSSIEFVQPDDDNEFDQTVIRVKLPNPVPPQKEIQLVINFETKLPQTIRRTGYYQDYYFVAQWFPKIGVFEDGVWNCHQYHARSEFFADYGIYDVNITVPSEYIVGATGEKRTAVVNGDETTYNYFQESVHDFAWTASKDYIETVENYALSSGKNVEITLLIMKEHEDQTDRYLNATEYAIKYYSEWYGDYPYSTVTVVDPAFRSGAGGMEYPTFFTGGTNWINWWNGVLRPEGVTVHEFGHGYFYGLIGNNEFEDAWLDEGFNCFAESEVMDAAYGPNHMEVRYFGFPLMFKYVKFEQRFNGLRRYREYASTDIIQRNAWDYMDHGQTYTVNAYSKPNLMLRTLKNYLGKEVFDEIMMTYSQRWWYKHPKPEDFFRIVNEISGKDMTWFFDQFVYGSDVLDYSIDKISSELETEPVGIFSKWGKDYVKEETESDTVAEAEETESDTVAEAEETESDTLTEAEEGEEEIYISEVLVRRLGGVKMPVDVQVKFDNGETILEEWDGQYRWKKFTYKKKTKITSAVVDPDHKYVIDINYTNNSKIMKKDRISSLKWASKWMFWLQNLLEIFSFFS